MRVAFFGTPEFAATQLAALLESRHDVVLVVAQPDRPAGRGHKLQPPPTKELALERSIEVLQPETLKKETPSGEEFFARFSALKPDVAIVAAYGRIIPTRVLNVTRFVNVHGSLLPRWRGAAPVQRALEAGDAETGVCLMDMVPELDAGDVIVSAKFPISPFDDSETLMRRVADLGAGLLKEHIDHLLTLPKTPQPSEGVTYAKQIEKSEAKIDWNRPARDVVNHARAMYPWPGAMSGELKLFGATRVDGKGTPGEVLSSHDGLVVACSVDAARFADGQLPGKKRMPIADLVRGKPIAKGTVLE